ncbi:MAG: Ca2+:H+ antiporter [Gaiellales bacterium]|nr:Ca2+:H+ antiporter [Gaiellales bacterium]
MIRRHAILLAGVVMTAVAGILHYAVSDTAGTIAASAPLLLVAPLVAQGTDALRGRLSTSVVGIVQSAFGNAAELAITVLALRADLPEVVKIAIVGSLLGNAVLLGGIAGLLPLIRNGFAATLTFDRRLFSGIATLSVIAFVPIAILSVPSGLLQPGDRRGVTLAAGVALTVVGIVFIVMELRAPAPPHAHGEVAEAKLSFRGGLLYLGFGGVMAAVTAEWFVAGFEPATKAIGIPAAFAALVIIPLLGNVAENYVALRYAWAGDGDGAMSVIMHSVVQIALLMTGILVIASQFIGRHALSLQLDPVLTVSLGLALVVLWMIMYDGEMQPVEAVGLLAIYVILGAAVWAEGSLGT